MMTKNALTVVVVVLAICVAPAHATWSIVAADTRTKEVAVGAATCLVGFDLRAGLPVVLVEVGGGASQGAIDQVGVLRGRMREQLLLGTAPDDIIPRLQFLDPFFDPFRFRRQFGIVDTQGRATTFSGVQLGQFFGGVTGQIGTITYAIQGNVITGMPVVDAAEAAFRDTPGDIPAKLMAAMEAARQLGGDGRCSCSPNDADGCGAPPPNFAKSAHIGFMIVARRGDTDGDCTAGGCATGDYFMNFNIVADDAADPDPVFQLQELFDTWRASRVGLFDQIASAVTFRKRLPPADDFTDTMQIELRDWLGDAASDVVSVRVIHDPRGSDGRTRFTAAADLGDGVYEVQVTSSDEAGFDTLNVEVTTATETRIVLPVTEVIVQPVGDFSGDGRVTVADINPFVLALQDRPAYELQYPDVVLDIVGDFNGDQQLGVGDISGFVAALTGTP